MSRVRSTKPRIHVASRLKMTLGKLIERLVHGDVPKFEIGTRSPILFLHIPKTAGVSIRQFLANQYHAKDICPWGDWRSLSLNDGQISGYKLVQGHFGINVRQILPSGFRALTVLRDPIQRTLSSIRHMQRDPQFHPLHHRVKHMTVSQIIQEDSLAHYFRNVQTGYLSSQQPPREILRYLRAENRLDADPSDIEAPADLGRATRQLDTIEFVGLCDDIGSLFSTLCEEMRFHFPVFPPRINVAPTDAALLSPPITERDLDLLREVNKLDIELYEYVRASRRCVARQGLDFKALMHKFCAEGIYRAQSRSFKIDIGDLIPGSGWFDAEGGKNPYDGLVRCVSSVSSCLSRPRRATDCDCDSCPRSN